jgi:hypothetical protein
MRWTDLKVGNWNVKITPITDEKESYPRCDAAGNILKYEPGKLQRGTYVNEATGEKFDTAFYLIDGQPSQGFERTKEVLEGEYKEVDLAEAEDLKENHLYLVECDALFEELNSSEKCLKFWFSNGKTSQYLAYLTPSKKYGESKLLFMKLGTTQISKKIESYFEGKEQQAKLKQISMTVQGIAKTKLKKAL